MLVSCELFVSSVRWRVLQEGEKKQKTKCSPPTFTRVLISESFGQTLLHKAAKPVNPCRSPSRHRSAQPCKMRPLLLLLLRYRVSQLSLPFNRISRGSCRWLRPRTSTPSLASLLAPSRRAWPLQSLGAEI